MIDLLDGIRVLDLSRVLAGPWATQMLADFGADVIKVEKPGAGDDTRAWGPPFVEGAAGEANGMSAYFLCANRGKRSIAVDITTPEGSALIRELALRSDVLVENFKPGGLKKYGLDWASLSALNPRLIYCSITGYGQTGPKSAKAGYDFAIQAAGGLMSITGERDDRPGGGPQKVGVAAVDVQTGLYAASAILAALVGRAKSGRGQLIDLSLFDVQVATLANIALNFLTSGAVPKRRGNAHASIVPYDVFRAQDDDLVIAVGNDGQFATLCRILGEPDWPQDARMTTNAARVENRDLVYDEISEKTGQWRCADLLAALDAAGVPCSPINSIDQVFADPQTKARDMVIKMNHPATTNPVSLVANPIHFSETPCRYDRPPPLLGQHSAEILRESLNLDPERLAALKDRKIVQ